MNFNYLMETKFIKRKCKAGHPTCYWVPVGNIRSTHGNNVHMTMHCRHCGTREALFLSKQDYKIQEKLILREVENV